MANNYLNCEKQFYNNIILENQSTCATVATNLFQNQIKQVRFKL